MSPSPILDHEQLDPLELARVDIARIVGLPDPRHSNAKFCVNYFANPALAKRLEGWRSR